MALPSISLAEFEKAAEFIAVVILAIAGTALSSIGRTLITDAVIRFLKSNFSGSLKAIPLIGTGLGTTLDLMGGDLPKPIEPEANETRPRSNLAKRQLIKRLDDAAVLRNKKAIGGAIFKGVAGLLSFAQYIVGGILASSFIQQKTTPDLIGALGVFVLLASLLTQKYHPEVSGQASSLVALKLDAVIRRTEDRMVIIEAKATDADDSQQFLEELEKLTTEINEISMPISALPKPKDQKTR